MHTHASSTPEPAGRLGLAFAVAGALAVPGLMTSYGQDQNRAKAKESASVKAKTEITMGIGGTGGVYFLAEPGQLVVEVEKRDRNRRGGRTELRAILVGPDREVLQEASIPDDGRPKGSGVGPAKRVRLSTQVERMGVYALNITVSTDRYGDDIIWGFRTNCPRYLIETARGHRDVRREEPIVLLNAGKPSDVCFIPRPRAFRIEVTGLPASVTELTVHDGKGALVQTLKVRNRRASHTFPADAQRGTALWRLHVPKQPAIVQIDGVTRWDRKDVFQNLPYWTPDPSSYFPFMEYRWLLTPYHRTIHAKPGAKAEATFEVHNNSNTNKTVQLTLEFPGAPLPSRLSSERIVLRRKGSAEVTLSYTAPPPGETRVCHLRARPLDDPSFTTYSTLTVKTTPAPAEQPLAVPLVLKPYQHENEQFGYMPDLPVEWELYFDLENHPFMRSREGLKALRHGRWEETKLATAVKSREPEITGNFSRPGKGTSKVAFDKDNDVYIVTTANRKAVLLHSADAGRTFAAYSFGRSGGLDIEQFSGHNVPDGPPPILRSIRTAADRKLRWRKISDLELFMPKKEGGRIVMGKPLLISKNTLGVGSHSGVPSAVVSRGSKVHVIWAEATDPKVKVPGVPTYVLTCDRETREMGEPVLVGYGAPPNDVHNRPCITMDSKGYLHALTGTHGRPFQYARSLKPNDAHSGWTKAETVGAGLSQTYIGMVCGPDDTLHVFFRLWKRDRRYHSTGASFAALSYQRKRSGRPWAKPRVIVVAPFSEYSIFYHRLTIDRRGRLFLSYDYWSTYWFYRTDYRGDRRTIMMSPDGGETWHLPMTADLAE